MTSTINSYTLVHIRRDDPWLYLGEVKWIEGALLSLLKGHHLDVQGPCWLNKERIQKMFHIHGTIQVFKLSLHTRVYKGYQFYELISSLVCQFCDLVLKHS